MLIIEESERTEKGYWKLCIYDTVFLYIKHCSKKQSALILFKSSWMSISYSSKFRAISMCTVQACECTQTHTHIHNINTGVSPHLENYRSGESLQSAQLSSVAQSCPTLCNPMDRSMPVFSVLHHLPELAQTHVHWVSDGHPTIASFVFPFSSCLQSFPASGSFLVSQLFACPLIFGNRKKIGASSPRLPGSDEWYNTSLNVSSIYYLPNLVIRPGHVSPGAIIIIFLFSPRKLKYKEIN